MVLGFSSSFASFLNFSIQILKNRKQISTEEASVKSVKNIFFKRANLGLFFFIFVFSELQLADLRNYIQITLPMLRLEPRISDVGSERSANCATTTALLEKIFLLKLLSMSWHRKYPPQ